MLKNFGKVFKFTFHNQTGPTSFKVLTITLAVILFLLPVGILLLVSMNANKNKDIKLKSCGAEKIYVADSVAENVDFSLMKTIDGEGYSDITYVVVKDADEAVSKIKEAGEKKSLILEIEEDESTKEISATIVLPTGSEIKKEDAEHFYDAIDKMDTMFVVLAKGITLSDMQELSKTVDTDIFKVSGWASGTSLLSDKNIANEQNNEQIRDGFGLILTLLVCMIMYFIVLTYGSSITKNIVMEKSSKLMDTLLISVKPESLVFGKLLGVLAAGLLQIFLWIAMLVGGVIAGVILSEQIFPDANSPVITFLKSFGSMDLFRPVPVILALVVLIFGIVLYAALAAFAGAISSTMEQAASNQGIFVLILIVSYFIVIFTAMDPNATPVWLYLVPFTAALTLPAGLVLGTVSGGIAIAGVAAIVVLALALVLFAGHVYKALALYKGTGGIKKVFKILTAKNT